MTTFTQARRIVEADDPGTQTATYGYESAAHWFPVILPERVGGRVPAVSKQTGHLTWVSGTRDEEFASAQMVGGPRP